MDKKKYPRTDALRVAKELCDLLRPDAERIIVAGSLRRGKSEVGDMEILYVPRFSVGRVDDLFNPPPSYNEAETTINGWVNAGRLIQRTNAHGSATWGAKNKLAIHVASGIPVDLFATTEENWWVSLVIRTGGKQTNLELTTGAQRMNRTLHAYGCGVEFSNGETIRATSEEHVFELCGVKYREPKERL